METTNTRDVKESAILHESVSQPFLDTKISAGLVEGCPPEEIYLQWERSGKPEDERLLLMQTSEALAILWVLSGAILAQEAFHQRESEGGPITARSELQEEGEES